MAPPRGRGGGRGRGRGERGGRRTSGRGTSLPAALGGGWGKEGKPGGHGKRRRRGGQGQEETYEFSSTTGARGGKGKSKRSGNDDEVSEDDDNIMGDPDASDYEDEEVDEDEAFDSADEDQYGDLLDTIIARQGKGKKGGGGGSSEDDENFEEEDEEEEEGGDVAEEAKGSAGPAGDEGSEEDEDEESEEEDDDDDSDSDSEGGREGDEKLLDFVNSMPDRDELRKAQRDRLIASQAAEESEFGTGGASSGGSKPALSVEALLSKLQGSKGFSGVKKRVERQQASAKPVAAPVAKAIAARGEREVVYQEASVGVDAKWQASVQANRRAETLTFGGRLPQDKVTAASLVAKFEPSSALEKEVQELLESGGLEDEQRAAMREEEELLEARHTTPEEVEARRAELSKMRALMFYHEQKRHHMNKIKSKQYRKVRKRQRQRLSDKEEEVGTEADPERAAEVERQRARERAEERVSMRHKNSSKWAKHALKYGQTGAGGANTKAAINEQLLLGQKLREKMDARGDGGGGAEYSDSSDSDGGSDSNGEGNGEERLSRKDRAALLRLSGEGGEGGEEKGGLGAAKGIMKMQFMQRAMERQREEAKEEAAELLRELGGGAGSGGGGSDDEGSEEEDGGSDDDDDDDETRARKLEAKAEAKRAAKAAAQEKKKKAVTAVSHSMSKDSMQSRKVGMDRAVVGRVAGAIAVDLGDGVEGGGDGGGEGEEGRDEEEEEEEEKEGMVLALAEEGGVQEAFTLRGTEDGPRKGKGKGKGGDSLGVGSEASPVDAPVAGQKPQEQQEQGESVPLTGENPWLQRGAAASGAIRGHSSSKGRKGGKGGKEGQQVLSMSQATESLASIAAVNGGKGGNGTGVKRDRGAEGGGQEEGRHGSGNDGDDADGGEEEGGRGDGEGEGEGGGEDGRQGGARKLGELSQEELIQRAFANPDAVDDFMKEKEHEMEQDAAAASAKRKGRGLLEPTVSAGWGSWTGAGTLPPPPGGNSKGAARARKRQRQVQEEKEKAALADKEAAKRARRDARLPTVILNEKRQKRSANLRVSAVPYPFTSKEQYERSLRQPLGKEWNTTQSFGELTRPEVVVKASGTVVQPISLDKGQKRRARQETEVRLERARKGPSSSNGAGAGGGRGGEKGKGGKKRVGKGKR